MTASPLPLHVEVMGRTPADDVPTFLLIHGYGASSFTWRYWAPRLAERGQVIALDLKGFGRAPKPDDGRYSPDDQADLVHRFIEERNLRRLTLVGHSLGGGVCLLTALRLLDRSEDRLARMVIVAGAAYAQKMPPFVRLAEFPKLSGVAFLSLGATRVVRAVLEQVVHDTARIDAAQVQGYAESLGTPEAVRALLQTARQIQPVDLDAITARYHQLAIPTLLIWGRGDRVVPLAVGERLARELPNARLHVLERCGHLPAEELPQESYALVEQFLDGHTRGDAAVSPPATSNPRHRNTGSAG